MRGSIHSAGGLWLSGLVVLSVLAVRVSAGEEPAGVNVAPLTPARAVSGVQNARPESATAISAAEVLKMAQAGVSQEVIKSYVENAPVVQNPTPEEVIALKQQGVADEVTTALIKRSAETRAANAAMVSRFVGQLRSQGAGHLDPESYEYFQHYYLFPRTLSSVYDRLGYYQPPNWWGGRLSVGPYWAP